MARLLRSVDPGQWGQCSRDVIQHLVMGVVLWSERQGRDVEVIPPRAVCNVLGIYSWARPQLSQLLVWVLAGLFTEEERKALGQG